MNPRTVLADVGGTNVRLALSPAPGRVERIERFKVAEYPDLVAVLDEYLARLDAAAGDGARAELRLAIGAAGPVVDGRVVLTNAEWVLERDAIAERCGAAALLLNDLQAVAYALPHLDDAELWPLGAQTRAGGAQAEDRGLRLLAINLGTGLGAATAVFDGRRWLSVPSEAGHMSLALPGALGSELGAELESLTEGYPPSIESLLSGPGLRVLYRCAWRRVAGAPAPSEWPQPEAILAPCDPGDPGDSPHARARAHTLDWLSLLLGQVCGDLVLSTAAWGGVYLCGSVARSWHALADPVAFRRHFEAKGAMQERMRGVFSAVIANPDVALLGLSHAAFAASDPGA
ncbi:MAG: glucokinase [Gammaproteobacteria bacterium]|nr:glucokinase [Gammaproteobacteria bacterium]